MFDTTKSDLKDLLSKVDKGELQLPDFQRDYVWNDDDVKSLIASIAKGFPVGALLTLETGGEVSFKPRVLEGVDAKGVEPQELLLDGQQRMTSLFQAAYSKLPVRTSTNRGTVVKRYYYIDINKVLDSSSNIDDAIIGFPEDRILRSNFGRTIDRDVSTREAEFEQDLFPLNQVFDSRDWFYDWRDYWRAKQDRDVGDLIRDFDRTVVSNIDRYKMPVISLDKSNTREAICLVFEKVNVGGRKLDAFELVTAIYAADNFDLRQDWNGPSEASEPGRRARMIGSPNRRDVLSKLASTDFLQACTLLHTREERLKKARTGATGRDLPQVTCRRDALLGLPLSAYRQYADAVEKGFVEASTFLNELKIVWHRDIPYPPQVVALASAFAILGNKAQPVAAKDQLEQWLWSVTFGELYGSSTESRMARDVPELVEWIRGTGERPASIDEAILQKDRFRSLRTRVSAAYKGVHALMMKHGCRDFITGRQTDIMTFFDDGIDVHHIFPQDWCKKQGIKPAVFNSIVNKTPLSSRTNRIIGGQAPSVYLKRIEDDTHISSEELDEILRTHLIDPQLLRSDDFEGFFEARIRALSSLVSDAMGKPVVEEPGTNEEETEIVVLPDLEELDELEEAV